MRLIAIARAVGRKPRRVPRKPKPKRVLPEGYVRPSHEPEARREYMRHYRAANGRDKALDAKQTRARRAARIADGTCPCGQRPPKAPGLVHCANCIAKAVASNRTRREARTPQGGCYTCVAKAEPGKTKCGKCLQLQARWAREQRRKDGR